MDLWRRSASDHRTLEPRPAQHGPGRPAHHVRHLLGRSGAAMPSKPRPWKSTYCWTWTVGAQPSEAAKMVGRMVDRCGSAAAPVIGSASTCPTSAADRCRALLNWTGRRVQRLRRHRLVRPRGPTSEVTDVYPPPFYDPLTAIAWLAGQSEDLLFATSVLVVPYRHPLLTAGSAPCCTRSAATGSPSGSAGLVSQQVPGSRRRLRPPGASHR